MQTAHEAANQALSSKPKPPTQAGDTGRSTKLHDPILVNFWERMLAMFGHTWASQYGAVATGLGADTWATALGGLSGMQIANGLRATLATGAEFPPSAPRFRAMCLGIPSLASVRHAMRKRQYDRFAALVDSKLNGYLFARVDQKTADRMVAEAYELAKEHVMRGGALPPEPEAMIEAPKPRERKPADPEFVKQRLQELEQFFAAGEAPTPEAA